MESCALRQSVVLRPRESTDAAVANLAGFVLELLGSVGFCGLLQPVLVCKDSVLPPFLRSRHSLRGSSGKSWILALLVVAEQLSLPCTCKGARTHRRSINQ